MQCERAAESDAAARAIALLKTRRVVPSMRLYANLREKEMFYFRAQGV